MTTSDVAPTPSTPTSSASPTESGGGFRVNRLAGVLVTLVALFMFGETALPEDAVGDLGGYDLVYDDFFLIVLNESMAPVTEDIGAAFQFFNQEYWEGVNPEGGPVTKLRGQALYRPLTLFIWALVVGSIDEVVATDGWPFHLLSVLANAWVVWLLFSVLSRLFRDTRLAVLASLLYAVHPLHSEAVAYVAGFSDVIGAGCVIWGLSAYERIASRRDRMAWGAYVSMLLAMFVGLLAKETGVLVLAVVALTDVMLTLNGRGTSLGHRVKVYAGLIGVLGAQLWLRYSVVGYLKPNTAIINRLDNPLIDVETNIRVLNSFKLLAKYVWLTLWPKDLSVDYSFNQIHTSLYWDDPEPLAGTVLIVAMVVVGLLKLRSSPAMGWGLLFFVGCATFTSNMLVPIGTIFAERTMYLPTVGMCLAGAVVLHTLMGGKRPGTNPIGLLVAVLVVGALGARTHDRNQDFKDPLTLFEEAARVSPNSARVHYQLGSLYGNARIFDKALEEFTESLRIDNQFIAAAIKMGDVNLADSQFQKAINVYDNVLASMGPGGDVRQTAEIRQMVLTSRAAAKQGLGDLEGAQADLELALSTGGQPGSALQLIELLQGQQRWDESLAQIEQALAMNPQDAKLLYRQAKAAVALRDGPLYTDTLERLKNSPEGRAQGLVLEAEGKYESALANQDQAMLDEAMAMFDEAASLDDTLATPYVFKGRYLVERPPRRFFDAIIQYDRALERAPRHPAALVYKAAAQLAVDEAEGALQTLQVYETVSPGIECYTLMSDAYFILGDTDGMDAMSARIRELGEEPWQVAVNRSVAADAAGDTERALEIIDQGMASSEPPTPAELLRHRGLYLYALGRVDEAFAEFSQLRTQLRDTVDAQPLPFLPINIARCLLDMGQYDQAAMELAAFEADIAQYDPASQLPARMRASLLAWRSILALTDAATAHFDPAAAEQFTDEGLEITQRRDPRMFELSMEALAAQGDLTGALLRAREAQANFPGIEAFGAAVTALQAAVDGDVDAAQAALTGDAPFLQKLAARL